MSSSQWQPPPGPASDSGSNIEADSIFSDDSDGGYATGSESYTTSLKSSVTSYVYENGRRYHAYKSGSYVLPNDETEQERLDLFHHVFNLLLHGELHIAPLRNPEHILDVGTGTGIWGIDIADKYPGCKVVANDLSPIQPLWVPPNLEFEVDDCEAEWLWPRDHFDLVHARTMAGSIKDWPAFYKQAYKHIKPGGFIEVTDFEMRAYSDDGTLRPDSTLVEFFPLLDKAATLAGLDFNVARNHMAWLKASPFELVDFKEQKVPLSAWPKDKRMKEIGRFHNENLMSALDAYCLVLFTKVMGWGMEKYQAFMVEVRKDLKDRTMHSYSFCLRYVARKPLNAGAEEATA